MAKRERMEVPLQVNSWRRAVKIIEHDGRTYFEGWGGLDLFFEEHHPENEPMAAIILIHGYAVHSGWLAPVIETFVSAGFSVFSFDLRGHGRSEGIRGDLVRFADYVRDISAFVDYVREKLPGKRVFVVAHSLGAAAAGLYASTPEANIDGLVATGIYIKDAGAYPRWKEIVGRLVAPFLPLLPIQELDPRRIAVDPAVPEEYRGDPLIYNGNVRIRMAMHFLGIPRYLKGAGTGIQVPLLMIHGAEDNLASIDESRRFHAEAASREKRFIEVEGSGHEVLKDYKWGEVCSTIIGWVNDHI